MICAAEGRSFSEALAGLFVGIDRASFELGDGALKREPVVADEAARKALRSAAGSLFSKKCTRQNPL